MIAVKLVKNAYSYLPEINQATLSGAIDVIVTEGPDGELRSTPFHVRFGKFHILMPRDRVVSIQVNEQPTNLRMKLGAAGEAYFCTDEQGDESLKTSPMTSPSNVGMMQAPLVNLDLENLPVQAVAGNGNGSNGGDGPTGGAEANRMTWSWGNLPTPTGHGMLLTDYISQLDDEERKRQMHHRLHDTGDESDNQGLSRDASAGSIIDADIAGASASEKESKSQAIPPAVSTREGSWVGSLFRWRSYKSDGGSSDQGKSATPAASEQREDEEAGAVSRSDVGAGGGDEDAEDIAEGASDDRPSSPHANWNQRRRRARRSRGGSIDRDRHEQDEKNDMHFMEEESETSFDLQASSPSVTRANGDNVSMVKVTETVEIQVLSEEEAAKAQEQLQIAEIVDDGDGTKERDDKSEKDDVENGEAANAVATGEGSEVKGSRRELVYISSSAFCSDLDDEAVSFDSAVPIASNDDAHSRATTARAVSSIAAASQSRDSSSDNSSSSSSVSNVHEGGNNAISNGTASPLSAASSVSHSAVSPSSPPVSAPVNGGQRHSGESALHHPSKLRIETASVTPATTTDAEVIATVAADSAPRGGASTIRALVSPRMMRSDNDSNITTSMISNRPIHSIQLPSPESSPSSASTNVNGGNWSLSRPAVSYSPPSSPGRRASSLPPSSPAALDDLESRVDNSLFLDSKDGVSSRSRDMEQQPSSSFPPPVSPTSTAISAERARAFGLQEPFVDLEWMCDRINSGNPVLEMALCKTASKNADEKEIEKSFDSCIVSLESFLADPIGMTANPQLFIRLRGKIIPARLATPVLLSLLAFNVSPPIQDMDKKIQKQSWMSWMGFGSKNATAPVTTPSGSAAPPTLLAATPPIAAVESAIATTTVTATEEGIAVVKTIDGVLPPPQALAEAEVSLCPTSEQLKRLPLHIGANRVKFQLLNTYVEATIYKWPSNSKIVISDIDGTITKSDVLGHILPLVGADWSQGGVAGLLSRIKKNGYQLLYLTARPIGQVTRTKNYLQKVQQDGYTLPEGPVFTSPDRLMRSLHREVIRKQPQEFKIACLKNVAALFPSSPFHAGFGNRDSDIESYLAVGVPPPRVFIVNPQGTIRNACNVTFSSTYTSLQSLVDLMFSPISSNEREEPILAEFNDFNFWKRPMYLSPDTDTAAAPTTPAAAFAVPTASSAGECAQSQPSHSPTKEKQKASNNGSSASASIKLEAA